MVRHGMPGAMAGGGPPIAIVGAACRLPGAPDLAAFARLLEAGLDAVTEVPADRFAQARFLHPRPGEVGRAPHFRAGTIGDVVGFDAPAFGISPREADETDPQQRLLLVLTRRALEDAGWPEDRVSGQPVGVYVGGSTTDYGNLHQEDTGAGDRYTMAGSALSILSNRIGNVFDLRGPAMTVDTACSSALVALHEACEALRHGRIPAAVVGGVNMLLSPFPFGGFWRAGMLSARGRCQAFGAGADGYVRAEGGVVLVLKPLAAALADGDLVRGVILASGVNGAGRTNGISLPDAGAQAALISAVLRAGRVRPAGLGYFEAHGTGTPAGDPIEAAAIAQAVQGRRTVLPIGSAKSNIGHTEAAAGLVGVLKALVVLETGRIPATLHCETPNPNIPFDRLGLMPATHPMPLAGGAVAVNSFGFGGTNACALLGAAPPPPVAREDGREAPPLVLSAQTPTALRRLAGDWATLLAKAPPARAAAMARGQARHRALRAHRLVLRGPRPARALANFARGEEVAGAATGKAGHGAGVGFLFTGNGAAWARMGAAEMRGSAPFRAAVERADAALTPQLGWSVAALLERGVTKAELARTAIAQPLLFTLQHAIVAALAEEGITPAFCIGHSVGEVAAAEAAGLLSLRQAARLIAARSRHQEARRGVGRMAVLGATPEEARPVLAECSEGEDWPVEIAAVNTPASLTVAGPEPALARLAEAAAARRWAWLPLDLDYAFHSAAMDPVRAGLLRDLRGLRGREGGVPLISTVTGQLLDPDACDAAYWWRNLREPVRFADAMATGLARHPALLVEIGPRPLLQGYLRTLLRAAGREVPSMATLRPHRARQADPFPALADAATAQGADPRGGRAFQGPAEFRALPALPLEPQPHWLPRSVEARPLLHTPPEGGLLGHRHGEAGEEWRNTLDTAGAPWLADHALGLQPILPAAAMVEIALEAGFLRHPATPWLEVTDFTILRPMPLASDALRELRARLDEEGGFRLESRRRLGTEAWALHATARLSPLPPPPEPEGAAEPVGEWQGGAALTQAAARLGLEYGPAFRPVTRFATRRETGQVRLELDLPATAPPDEAFHLHPVRLDGALQGLLGLLGDAQEGPARDGFLPVRFGRVLARREGGVAVAAEIAITAPGERGVAARITLRDALGRAVARLEEATFQRVPLGERAAAPPVFHGEWVPAPVPLGWPEAAPALDPAMLDLPPPGPPLEEAALLLDAHAAAAAQEAGLATAEGPLAHALRAHLGAAAQELPAAHAIWQQVMLEAPALAQELATLAEAAEALPTALPGLPMPPARLSPDAESLHRLGAALAHGAARLLEGWPAARPCRVLLAGATEGPLLPALRQALPSEARLIATHLPGQRPPPVPPGVELAEWDPAGPDAPPAEAELVLALALSPRRAGGQALAEGLRRATAPGGALLLAEPLPSLFWDMTEGLAAEWWTTRRLLDAAGWNAALLGAGWDRPRILPLPPSPWPAALVAAAMPESGQLLPAAMGRHFALWNGPAKQEWANALAEALAAAGARVTRLPENPAPATLRGATLLAWPEPGPEGLAATAQLAATAEGVAEGLHLVTRGGATRPGAAGLLALGRVLANEMSALRPRRHDLDLGLDPQAAARRLAAALLTPPDAEAEQLLTQAGRLVPRVAAGVPAPPPPPGPLRLAVGMPGQLGTLAWQPAPEVAAHPLGPGEVRLSVQAVGLNFRDVMWAQGLLPEDILRAGFAGPGLGMELAGVVEAVGPGCALAPGQPVLGVAPRALATRAVTREEALVPRPGWLAPEEAAGLPVAFLTAVHALEELGRIAPGDRVLIHGGAGAVGLAALQVALAAGARVAATAGTEARRALLRAAGAEVALDSRSAGFAEELRAHWEAPPGEGCVDLCLNSLSGEAMERSLALMAPFGRFLELGKRDYAEARRAPLRPLRRNVSYFAVDVDELARARPALARRHLESLMRRLEEGVFRPLPVRVHAAATVEDAFRRLQAGGHVGKLVIRPPEEAAEAGARPRWMPPQAGMGEGWVVVVGGTTGFGLEAARWLAGQGARRLALLSRRGAAAPGAVEAAESLGPMTRLLACDATDAAALSAALEQLRAEAPITGVVHAAAVLSDGVAARLDARAARSVWDAKVVVAENLDRLTEADEPGLFLLFSSATVPIGSPGQAAYVAANAGMEALARRRQAQGRPALAVQWGPISDAGMLAGEEARAEGLARRLGAVALTAREALDRLPALLESGVAVAGVARLDWPAARRSLALLAEPPFLALAGQVGAEGEAEDISLPALRAMGEDAARDAIQRMVGVEIGRILRLPAHSIALDAPLAGLGLDSLGGLELRTALERRFSVSLPLQGVGEGLTVQGVAQLLLDGLKPGREAAE
ncbi:type I polyketide synthase [Roseococcus thiosulfatophilus]|uniref:type I polyketide synthase n=1 Tax=Roseococcus thiosulfatophilus TaxID=35813 RepID=UPI001F5C52A5|nr:type I polyketide synthase [Roseococcus thiosulfatophilus]